MGSIIQATHWYPHSQVCVILIKSGVSDIDAINAEILLVAILLLYLHRPDLSNSVFFLHGFPVFQSNPPHLWRVWSYMDSSFSTAEEDCRRVLSPSLSASATDTSPWNVTGRGHLWVPGERPWGTAHLEALWVGVRKWKTLKGTKKHREKYCPFSWEEMEQGDMGGVLEILLEDWKVSRSKQRDPVDSGWTQIVPRRGDVTMDAIVGASFGKIDAGMGYLGKWTWIKEFGKELGKWL